MSGAPNPLASSVRRIHVVGIGGKGMSAIAAALLDRGYEVSGSDLEFSTYTEQLARRGAEVYLGHAPQQVVGADLVIHSAAIANDNVELAEAARRSIARASRAEIVAALFNEKTGIAVAGTHGKTTTSAMIATILREAGYDPGFLIGARVPSLGDLNGRWRESAWMVVEADEFDDAFLLYRPSIAVLTHLEPDHLDYFGSTERMVAAFEKFVDGLGPDTTLIARADIALLRPVAARHAGRVVWFGPGEGWDITAYAATRTGVSLDVTTPDGPAVSRLAVHGRHNAWNAVAAMAAAVQAGVALPEAARGAGSYVGADRRMQRRAEAGGITVLEDYAHHPTAVRATISAAREFPHQRLWAIYQPLLASRTRDLFADFLGAFEDADRVVFAEIFSPPGRESVHDVSAAELASAIRHPNAYFCPTFEQIASLIAREARRGDLLLVMGPESISPLADRLAAWVHERAAA